MGDKGKMRMVLGGARDQGGVDRLARVSRALAKTHGGKSPVPAEDFALMVEAFEWLTSEFEKTRMVLANVLGAQAASLRKALVQNQVLRDLTIGKGLITEVEFEERTSVVFKKFKDQAAEALAKLQPDGGSDGVRSPGGPGATSDQGAGSPGSDGGQQASGAQDQEGADSSDRGGAQGPG